MRLQDCQRGRGRLAAAQPQPGPETRPVGEMGMEGERGEDKEPAVPQPYRWEGDFGDLPLGMICTAGQNEQTRNTPIFSTEPCRGTHPWSCLFSERGTFLGLCTCRSATVLNMSLCCSIIILKSDEAMKLVRDPTPGRIGKRMSKTNHVQME